MLFLRLKSASIVAGIFILAAAAHATETRVQTLRGVGGIEDETLVFAYPGMISKYKVALVELGTAASTEAYAAAFTDVGGLSLGAAVSRTTWLFSNIQLGTSVSLFDRYETAMLDLTTAVATRDPYLHAPFRPIELLAGFNIGAGTLGIRFSYADYKNKQDTQTGGVTTTTNQTAQQMELAVGFHTDAVGPLDIALTLDPTEAQKRTDSANSTESSTSVKGSSIMLVDVRWLSTDTASSPYVKAKMLTRSYKASGTSGGRDFSGKFSDAVNTLEGGYVGIASNKTAKLFTGLELAQYSSKGPSVTGTGTKTVPSYLSNDESVKLDATVINGSLSGEADVAGGFGAMAGMKYVMFGDVTEKDNTTNKNLKTTVSFPETSDATLWSLGVYYKADALRIDASYAKDILYNGPNFISGNVTPNFIGRISASYLL